MFKNLLSRKKIITKYAYIMNDLYENKEFICKYVDI